MKSRYFLSLIAAAALALPAAVPASQPEVTLAELQPAAQVMPTSYELAMLLLDPYQHVEFEIVLPESYTTLDTAVPAEH
ncbi:MAG TPA: hypothetical protein VGN80_04405 [Devosiaceae bacterium]|nr:hypothetical protein [Devosiaceae bacterium]